MISYDNVHNFLQKLRNKKKQKTSRVGGSFLG